MTSRLTIAEATEALDAAIARHKAAENETADFHGDVLAAREALNAAFVAEDERLPQCTVAVQLSSGQRFHAMVVVERNKNHIKCRYIGSRDGLVTFKWNDEKGAYIDRNRRISALHQHQSDFKSADGSDEDSA